MPLLVAVDAMPKVAFAPLFIAWLGFGISSKVALATFIATFPIVVSTAAGLYAASENERFLFKSMGASRFQTLVRLKLPTGLPYFFTGLKIASVGVMAGAITGEFLGGGKGVGALIRVSASQLDTPRVFSADHLPQLSGAGDVHARRLGAADLRVLEQAGLDRRRGVTASQRHGSCDEHPPHSTGIQTSLTRTRRCTLARSSRSPWLLLD